jgi:uncharacterized protein YkwD
VRNPLKSLTVWLLLLSLGGGVRLACAGPDLAPDLASDEDVAQAMLERVNAERERAGCGPLRLDARLTKAAMGHARAMARDDFFAHEDKAGRHASDRVRAEGYTYTMVGENISAGYDTVHETMDGWMRSPGHRANILTCAFKDLGVGHVYQANDTPLKGVRSPYRHYWVQVFGLEMTR